jgi:Zn-dependent protease with chaperone function
MNQKVTPESVQALIDKIAQSAGYTAPIALSANFDLHSPVAAGRWPDGTAKIVVNPNFAEFLGLHLLAGAIAHEVGHIVSGDIDVPRYLTHETELREKEMQADRFAVKLGYGKQLADVFRKLAPMIDDGEPTHPLNTARIQAIEAELAV